MLSLSIEKKRIGGNYDWVKIERENDLLVVRGRNGPETD